jgi:3-demethoxyubiquinol 3-hydroxylase
MTAFSIRCAMVIDRALAIARVIRTPPTVNTLPYSSIDKKLMRINHAGEVMAQGLYVGQALFSKDTTMLYHAMLDEMSHLVQCQEALTSMNAHASCLTYVWYSASVLLGMVMGLAPSSVGMGFIVETERQVAQHLEEHLQRVQSAHYYHVLYNMRLDELNHLHTANTLGATALPKWLRYIMWCGARTMKGLSGWL